jgi:hypothetical protein
MKENTIKTLNRRKDSFARSQSELERSLVKGPTEMRSLSTDNIMISLNPQQQPESNEIDESFSVKFSEQLRKTGLMKCFKCIIWFRNSCYEEYN